jgi:hypothetical protein
VCAAAAERVPVTVSRIVAEEEPITHRNDEKNKGKKKEKKVNSGSVQHSKPHLIPADQNHGASTDRSNTARAGEEEETKCDEEETNVLGYSMTKRNMHAHSMSLDIRKGVRHYRRCKPCARTGAAAAAAAAAEAVFFEGRSRRCGGGIGGGSGARLITGG